MPPGKELLPWSSSILDSAPIRLAADVGGTLTDVAAFNGTSGELQLSIHH